MPATPPPPSWALPVSPLVVERRFRAVAPYGAGGHRGLDLGVEGGAAVRAPCGGRVLFRGRVAGGPPTVTIACGTLRATLQRVESPLEKGDRVARGAAVGVATASALDLSARLADGAYLDPLPLLAAAAARHRVPPAVPRRPPERRPARPAHLRSRPVTVGGAPERAGAPVDWLLGAGSGSAVLAALAAGLLTLRRRRGGAWPTRRLPTPALVARVRR